MRPSEALERLLGDLSTLDLDPAIESVWIIDDSKQQASVALNANVIASHKESLPVPVAHIDPVGSKP